jgi:hypothetical protein
MTKPSYSPPPIRPTTAHDWLWPALVLACLGAMASLACNLHQSSQIENLGRMLAAERDGRIEDQKRFEKRLAAENVRRVAVVEKRIKGSRALMPAADAANRAATEIADRDDELPRLTDPESDDRLNPDVLRADLWQPEKLPDEVLHADDPGRRKPGINKPPAKQAKAKKVRSGNRPNPVDPDVKLGGTN